MHYHFDFSAAVILWTLTFAAELVLLVVLLGRDRARRFPWFTASIIAGALLLLVSRLIVNRVAPLTGSTIFLVLSDVAAAISLVVPFEIARRAFAGASRRAWTVTLAICLVIAAGLVVFWGAWPAWNTFAGGSRIATMRGMELFADKGSVLYAFLDVELAVVLLLFGRRYRGGWRSHPQMIAIGLSTAGLAQMAVRLIWQLIATHTTVHSRAEYEHFMDLRDRLFHANNVVFLCALIWWITWLWLDEPGSSEAASQRS